MRFFIFAPFFLFVIFTTILFSADFDLKIPDKKASFSIHESSFKEIQKLYKKMKKTGRKALKAIRHLEKSPYFSKVDFKKELGEIDTLRVKLTTTQRNRKKIEDWLKEVADYKRITELTKSLSAETDFEMPENEMDIYNQAKKIIEERHQELLNASDAVFRILSEESCPH